MVLCESTSLQQWLRTWTDAAQSLAHAPLVWSAKNSNSSFSSGGPLEWLLQDRDETDKVLVVVEGLGDTLFFKGHLLNAIVNAHESLCFRFQQSRNYRISELLVLAGGNPTIEKYMAAMKQAHEELEPELESELSYELDEWAF